MRIKKMGRIIITLFLVSQCLTSVLAQITEGECAFVMTDSVNGDFQYLLGVARDSTYKLPENWSDTVIEFKNGHLSQRVVDTSNYKETYEQGRDTLTAFFNAHYVLGFRGYNTVHLTDLDAKISTVYVKKQGKYVEKRTMKLYDSKYFGQESDIFDLKIDTIFV